MLVLDLATSSSSSSSSSCETVLFGSPSSSTPSSTSSSSLMSSPSSSTSSSPSSSPSSGALLGTFLRALPGGGNARADGGARRASFCRDGGADVDSGFSCCEEEDECGEGSVRSTSHFLPCSRQAWRHSSIFSFAFFRRHTWSKMVTTSETLGLPGERCGRLGISFGFAPFSSSRGGIIDWGIGCWRSSGLLSRVAW